MPNWGQAFGSVVKNGIPLLAKGIAASGPIGWGLAGASILGVMGQRAKRKSSNEQSGLHQSNMAMIQPINDHASRLQNRNINADAMDMVRASGMGFDRGRGEAMASQRGAGLNATTMASYADSRDRMNVADSYGGIHTSMQNANDQNISGLLGMGAQYGIQANNQRNEMIQRKKENNRGFANSLLSGAFGLGSAYLMGRAPKT